MRTSEDKGIGLKSFAMVLAALVFALPSYAEDYYVDCVNGDDSRSGLTEAAAFRTIQRALNAVDWDLTIHISDGVCPYEGGLRYPDGGNLTIIGRGSTATVVEDSLLPTTANTYRSYMISLSGVELRTAELRAEDSASVSDLVASEVQLRDTFRNEIADSTIQSVRTFSGVSGTLYVIKRSRIESLDFVHSDCFLGEDSVFGSIAGRHYECFDVLRSRMRDRILVPLDGDDLSGPFLEANLIENGMVFSGGEEDTFVTARQNTFLSGGESALVVEDEYLILDVVENVFAGHAEGAIRANQSARVEDNDFYGTGPALCDSAHCYEVPELNAQPYASGNLSVDPRFRDPSQGDYRLQADSPLVDYGGTEGASLDFDGVQRPVDGDGDGIARHDVGAFEFVDLDGDSDDDQLPDVLDTAPLDPDADEDGLADGQDVEFVQTMVAAIPAEHFRSLGEGNRRAILNILEQIEALLLAGKTDQAMSRLENLGKHLDGCGSGPDANDWIRSCASQISVRERVDLLIANLGGA